MDEVSATELKNYPESFQPIKSEFEMSVEMVSPAQYGSTVAEDLFHVPLSMKQMKSLNIEKAKRMKFKGMTKPPEVVVVNQKEKPVSKSNNDSFQRTFLLLNTVQMLQEGYPMPVKSSENSYKNFKYTNKKYSTVTSQSPMFGLDCEMCMTTAKRPELTWVSVINENLETVYNTLVKPYNKVTNYLTRWSGITKALLDPVNKRLEEVQRDLQKLLPPDAILCGQSLQCDLLALQMFHPYVIDTSVIYNLSGQHGIKPSLKILTQRFLGYLYENSSPHLSF
ncbi:hypothetical protein FSP39_024652 [Pinctada imbricata]|uniref:Exonuclease domain-containing protein n=1 Tax=Pinctada imbricata TaxID=66713 RepID=A0AA89BY92_PINIB|nr:hypothetical protein FSP39_024652 [Pinctada imbricata]